MSPRQPETPNDTPVSGQANLLIDRAFNLMFVVIFVTILATFSEQVPWYAIFPVIIGMILFIALIGLFQLMLEGKLSQDNFVTLIREILKHLHLLKR
jgi:type IV secretory pathway TrbL component